MILFMNIDVLYLQLSFLLKLIISQYLNVERTVEEERENKHSLAELKVRTASGDESGECGDAAVGSGLSHRFTLAPPGQHDHLTLGGAGGGGGRGPRGGDCRRRRGG